MDGERESTNVEDRRGASPGLMVGGGIGGIVILIIVTLLGGDPKKVGEMLNPGGAAGGGAPAQRPLNPEEEKLAVFVKKVLGSTEDIWGKLLPQQTGKAYVQPKLVMFTGQVQTACGGASAAVGPFYCPGDQKVYIDLSFYDQMKRQLGAPGDFAQAYVIAHEVGHHIQNLLGKSDEVHAAHDRVDKVEYNRLSVRLELQADFYAGVWAHHAQELRSILDPGDLEEAINAAHQIGDDTLQKQAQGRVVPDSFTHGSAAQRMAWFKRGFDTGDMRKGNTFDDAVFNAVAPR
jgi:predicted metalloprotease